MSRRTGIVNPAIYGIVGLSSVGNINVLIPFRPGESIFVTHVVVTISLMKPRGKVSLEMGINGTRIAEWRETGSYPMDFGSHGLPFPLDIPLNLKVEGNNCAVFCSAVGYSV